MAHPSREAPYLAGPTPPRGGGVGRRSLLRGVLAGAGLLGASGLLACGADADSGPVGPSTLTFGSNRSTAVPRRASERVVAAFEDPSVEVETNVFDERAFRTDVDSYLQGIPDDVFTWSAGLTVPILAAQDLIGDVSDVWRTLPGMSDVLRGLSSVDGRQYLVPFTFCPWGVYYRPSLFADKGWTPPATFDELVALCAAMQDDGLVPFAFADAEGWPAMGTFDQLDLRINGYDRHLGLMTGVEPWDSARVRAVFDTWRRLLPYQQPGAESRSWQEAADSLLRKEAGMYVTGMFVSHRFDAPADRDDLDFFAFPEIDPVVGTGAVEAPLDGFLMPANPHDAAAARRFLAYLGSPGAVSLYTRWDPATIAAGGAADTSGYTRLQRRAGEFLAGRTQIAQFLDRDTRPDFARRIVGPALQEFLRNPGDVDGLVRTLEIRKQALFTS